MTIDPGKIIAARHAHPEMTLQRLAKEVGSSYGVVRRTLAGERLTPRMVVKLPRRTPYAGKP